MSSGGGAPAASPKSAAEALEGAEGGEGGPPVVAPTAVLRKMMDDGIFDSLKSKILSDLKQNVRA